MPTLTGKLEGLTAHLAFAIAAAVIGSGFQHGYHTGVVNAPESLIKEFINESSYFSEKGRLERDSLVTVIHSVVVSVFSLGGMLGALSTAFISERFGRRGGLLVVNPLVFVACALMGFCKMARSPGMLIVGRFVIGVNSGLNAGLAPMYLTEISPVHLRGAVGSIYQLIIVISISLSQILGLPEVLGTPEGWPILLALSVVPTFFLLVTLWECPESPRYILTLEGEDLAAQNALRWFRQTDAEEEMNEMKEKLLELQSLPKVTLTDMWRNHSLRRPLFISAVVMISQQLSGVNAIIYYSTGIFIKAGLTAKAAVYATIGIGLVNFLMTIFSIALVEMAGRKVLLLVGLGGMMVVTLLFTICLNLSHEASWLSIVGLVLVIVFIMLFAVGPGPIPWFLVNEFFTQGPRPNATGIAVAVNWLANFAVGLCFLPVQDAIGEYVFLIFSAFLALFFIYVYFEVPETKGRKVEEIVLQWR